MYHRPTCVIKTCISGVKSDIENEIVFSCTWTSENDLWTELFFFQMFA